MKPDLLDLIACPRDGRDLRREGDELVCADGHRYPIRDGVPRLLADPQQDDVDQTGTSDSFGAKWAMVRPEDLPRIEKFQYPWYDARYGFGDEAGLREALAGARTVLDAGSGLGYDAARFARVCPEGQVVGLELTDLVTAAHHEFGAQPNLHFVQGDIMRPPFRRGAFDYVSCDQVIHHTPDAEAAFHTLTGLLRPNGTFATYVYRRKSPLREYADDYLRERAIPMSAEECVEFSEGITELGRELSRLRATIKLERGIPLLGIPAGEHDVQRLIYWHFLKCFWNEELGEHQSMLGNFDWYHPPYASRHSREELLGWVADAGLSVTYVDEQDSGISVRVRAE
jgi:SAM-dependent methyltransferase